MNELFDLNERALKNTLTRWVDSGYFPEKQNIGIKKWLSSPNTSYESFRELIEVVSKESIYGDKELIKSWLQQKKNDGKIKFIPSAGTSGRHLSFRCFSKTHEDTQFNNVEAAANQVWNISVDSMLVLNTYPSGIIIPEKLNSIECGARLDILKLALRDFCESFDHFLIVAQPQFFKLIVDSGVLTQYDVKRFFYVLGGEWYPYTFIPFCAQKLGLSNKEMLEKTISSYGVAELGLGIGFQSKELSLLRASLLDEHNRKQVTVTDTMAVPMFFFLDSNRFFIEQVNGRLVVTVIDPTIQIPLVRYDTGDYGKVFSQFSLNHASGFDLQNKGFYFSVEGRKPLNYQDYPQHADYIQEIYYSSDTLLNSISSDFVLNKEALIVLPTNKANQSQVTEEFIKNMGENMKIHFSKEFIQDFYFKRDTLRKAIHYTADTPLSAG